MSQASARAGEPKSRSPRRLDVLGAVAAGGAVGSLARYATSTAFPVETGSFPTPTLIINISGSLLLGFVLVLLTERLPSSRIVRAFIAVGVLGAFTTFSSFAVDTVQLTRNGHLATASSYFVASVLAGCAAARLGVGAARAVHRRQAPPPTFSPDAT